MVEDRANSPPDQEDEEVTAKVADDTDAFLSAVQELYRGEVSQSISAQDRIDRTTNWAITMIIALLSVVFSSRSLPAYLLLIGLIALGVFLTYEVRRYRTFDLYRARVRLLQQNVFGNVLVPSAVEDHNWREELSDDLISPTYKVSLYESISRRLTRIYGLLFTILGLAWIAKVTLFTPETQWTEAAALPGGVSGVVVGGVLGVVYLGILALMVWPHTRQAQGEIYGDESGIWKNR